MKRWILGLLVLLFGSVEVNAEVLYTLTDLGTLGGSSSFAYDINSSGQVVGYSYIGTGESHVFLHDGVTMHDLGTLGTNLHSRAYGINDRNEVVGQSWLPGNGLAFLFDGVMNDLGNLGGNNASADAWRVNNLGQVAGSSYWEESDGGHRHAAHFQNGGIRGFVWLGGFCGMETCVF